ncbi:UNVERIFIED_CONTAM: putative late blight resistance proteinR1B-14 [Sesamum radiatum]|uniref:Late blight resistance proteinR1B-14 n=1 Tax=Sesamum radiatum TaxID=300843 RepID=A0AAW2JXU2_SESRA
MAYAALVSVAETLSQTLKHHHYPFVLHEKPLLQALHEHVKFLRAFLEDFPQKAKDLEGRIGGAATEAEDVIEYLLFEEIRSLNSGHLSPRQSGSSSDAHRFQRRFQKQYEKLQNVAEDIKSVVEEVMGTTSSLGMQELQLGDSSPPPTSSSVLVPAKKDGRKDAMVGLEDDLLAIKGRLCGESRKLEFIPIHGKGGIGYQKCFFTLVNSIKAFKETFDEAKHSYERTAEHVYKNLKGRRYLVVLDDIWSTKAWDDVRRTFPDDNNGSRIILTTRLQDVAAYADSSSPVHEMHFMGVDQSWKLLRHKVF